MARTLLLKIHPLTWTTIKEVRNGNDGHTSMDAACRHRAPAADCGRRLVPLPQETIVPAARALRSGIRPHRRSARQPREGGSGVAGARKAGRTARASALGAWRGRSLQRGVEGAPGALRG